MKVIERPTSTTYVLDFEFHLIKDETEMKNVVAIIGEKKIVQIARTFDLETFQPMLAFAIPEDDKPFSEWMKYITKLELIVN
jgi:hypothetical protein